MKKRILECDEIVIDEMRKEGKTFREIAMAIGREQTTIQKNFAARHPEASKKKQTQKVSAGYGWTSAIAMHPVLLHTEASDFGGVTQSSDIVLVFDGESYWVARYCKETTEFYRTVCYREIKNGVQVRAKYWCPIPAPTWS